MHALTPTTLLVALMLGCSAKPADRSSAADSTPPAAGPDTTRPPAAAPAATPQPVKTPPPAPTATRPHTTPAPKPAPAETSPTVAATTAPDSSGPVHDQWHPAPRDTLDGETYQGWKQFELNCSRCHGEYAVGSSFAPALVVSLKEGGTIPTKEVFIATVCAGRMDKGMPSWCALGLEMNKIEEIYRYVKGRADGKIAIGRPALKE